MTGSRVCVCVVVVFQISFTIMSSLPSMTELKAHKDQADRIREEKEQAAIALRAADEIRRKKQEDEISAKCEVLRIEREQQAREYDHAQNKPEVWDAMIAKWDIPNAIRKTAAYGSRSTEFCVDAISKWNQGNLMQHLKTKYKDSPEYKFSFSTYDGGYKRYEERDCIKVKW